MTAREIIWKCDPVGCCLLVVALATIILSLNWAGGTYEWHSFRVCTPFTIGIMCAAMFGLYSLWMKSRSTCVALTGSEWKSRPDGIVAHESFAKRSNFWYAIVGVTVEGYCPCSALQEGLLIDATDGYTMLL